MKSFITIRTGNDQKVTIIISLKNLIQVSVPTPMQRRNPLPIVEIVRAVGSTIHKEHLTFENEESAQQVMDVIVKNIAEHQARLKAAINQVQGEEGL